MQDEHNRDMDQQVNQDDNMETTADGAIPEGDGISYPQQEALQAEMEQLNKQVSVLKEQVMRERAENDNLRKRQERELQNAHKYATERLIKDLLPVLDSLGLGLDAAHSNANQPDAIAQFIEGSEMTLKLLHETLSKHGVVEVNPEGEKFDPEQHEAVTALPNDEVAPNTVLHVAQKGYTLNGRVIRAAQVVVAKAN